MRVRLPLLNRSAWPVWGLTAVLTLSEFLNDWRRRPDPPDDRQSIAAVLVSWGMDGGQAATRPGDRDAARWVARLDSPDSEERVRAAWWLGSRGVRSAGPAIAAAMSSRGTGRPCQLAHQLGKLGDDRWVPLLLDAANQSANSDLQACALLALGETASADATDGLIALYRDETTAVGALAALGEIADPRSAPFLRSVVARPRHADDGRLAARALERIDILARSDPVPALVRRITEDGQSPGLDAWVVRRLVALRDHSAVKPLAAVLARPGLFRQDRIILAAALTAFGEEGATALRNTAFAADAQSIIAAAIVLCHDIKALPPATTISKDETDRTAPSGA